MAGTSPKHLKNGHIRGDVKIQVAAIATVCSHSKKWQHDFSNLSHNERSDTGTH